MKSRYCDSRSGRKRKAMARKTKEDQAFNEAFYRLAHGIQFNIMDLGKVRSYCRDQVQVAGSTMDDAIRGAINLWAIRDRRGEIARD